MHANEIKGEMRHPFNSSELFNAFAQENQRENKTMGFVNKKWTGTTNNNGNDLTPPIMKENHSRIQSQGWQGNFRGDNYNQNQIDYYKNNQQDSNQVQKKSKIGNFMIPQQSNDDDDLEHDMNNFDQEYHMTEQDFDGHEQQYQDEDQFSQDQDHTQYNRQPHFEDNSQEGNIPNSSLSASPDEKQINQKNNEDHYLSNIVEYNEENLRESNMRRSSNPTTEKSSVGDLPFCKNNNMIYERNDRFIIFKMIPQANSTVKHSQHSLRDQITPNLVQRDLQFQNSKAYRETVEDIQSSSDSSSQKDLNPQRNQSSSNINNKPGNILKQESITQSPINNNIDESLFEETHVVQHEIRTMNNQLINSQMQNQTINKPPSGKKSEQTTPLANSNQRNYREQISLQSQQSSIQFNQKQDTSNEDQKQNLSKEIQELHLKKSLTTNSRSSVDKFNKLQKLEKKNIYDENLDAGEFTMTNTNLNYHLHQQQMTNHEPFLQTEEFIEPSKINERRQSDSIVFVRNSLIQQQQQQQEQILQQTQELKNQMNLSTNNTNANTVYSNMQEQIKSQNAPDNEKLLIEYKMLKQMMKQMKKEPTKQKLTTQNKCSNQGALLNSQRLQKSQAKSKKNLKTDLVIKESQYKSNNVRGSYVSDDDCDKLSKKVVQTQKGQGVFSVQQSTTNRDVKNKNFFQKEQIQPKSVIKRDFSKNKLSQRQSPNREKSQKMNNQTKSKPIKHNKRIDNDSDIEDERDISSHSSPQKSQRTKKYKNNNYVANRQTEKQKPKKIIYQHKKQRHQKLESSGEDNSAEEESEYYSYSHEDSQSNHENYQQRKRCEHSKYNGIKDDSYFYEENDQEQEDSEDYYSDNSGSILSHSLSQSESQNSSSYSESHHRQKRHIKHRHHHRQPKDDRSKSRKGQVIKTYAKADRRSKNNAHMHANKGSRQRQEKQHSQDEFLQKQRQLLQQQYMIQYAQYPQQQMLLQQQLAMQQQMLMQPPIQTQPFYNQSNNIQSTFNLGNQQPQLDISQNINQQQQNNSIIPNSQNISVILKQQEDFPLRTLKKNVSGSNLNIYQPNNFTQRDRIIQNLSPKRDFPNQVNNNGQSQNTAQSNFNYMRSPREQSANSHFNDNDQGFSQQQQHQNYLLQLKNRFKTGAGIGNASQREQNVEDEYYQNHGGYPIPSRNNQIIQNNSSPLTRQHQEYNYQQQINRNRPESIDYRDNHDGIGRFEEARSFTKKSLFAGEQYRHARTNSYLDNKQRDFHQTQVNNCDEDQYEQIRRKYKPESAIAKNNNVTQDVDQYPTPKLMSKNTGDFGRELKTEKVSPIVQSEDLFKQNREMTRSPSLDACDLSMDEGVKASTTRQTMQKSPKASVDEFNFAIMKQNQTNQNQGSKFSLIKKLSTKNDQDKKGPQALWIGFEDAQIQKDPFQNKPALKQREKIKDPLLRSKSTKGTTPSIKSQKGSNFQQRRSPDSRPVKTDKDLQLKSPANKYPPKADKTLKNTNLMNKKESPLKKAVQEIKQKDNFSLVSVNPTDLEAGIQVVNNNKGIMIEIFDNKKKTEQNQEVSLAEMFKAKKKDALLKQENQKQQEQDLEMEQEQDNQPQKKGKTKEELAELRKQMMKSKVKRKDNQSGQNLEGQLDINGDLKKGKKDPKQDLMARLAMGQKVQVIYCNNIIQQVDKKEMKKLTNKNYSNLPEIKKKKEEEQKKQEHMARKAAATEYMKQLNDKRKQLLKKKKSIIEEY